MKHSSMPLLVGTLLVLGTSIASVSAQRPQRIAPRVQPGKASAKTLVKDSPLQKIKYSKTAVDIREFGGEFTQWVKELTFNEAGKFTFRWLTNESPANGGIWEISKSPFPNPALGGATPPIIAKGYLKGAPTAGHQSVFSVDFLKFAPKKINGKDVVYYLRVTPWNQRDAAGLPSLAVTLRHAETKKSNVKFTTSGLYPELWSPRTVKIKLNNFKVLKADEENDEEPYVFVAVLWADGTTVNPSNFAASSVRVDSPKKTHGNVPATSEFGTGDSASISKIGTFERKILPIGLDFADLTSDTMLTKNTHVYILVAAMEEDASSTSSVNAARAAFEKAVKNEANKIVRSMTLADVMKGAPPKPDLSAIEKRIREKVVGAGTNQVTSTLWNPVGAMLALDDVVDPDDFVGFNWVRFSYEDLRRAKEGGLPIKMEFKGNGSHYRITGSIR